MPIRMCWFTPLSSRVSYRPGRGQWKFTKEDGRVGDFKESCYGVSVVSGQNLSMKCIFICGAPWRPNIVGDFLTVDAECPSSADERISIKCGIVCAAPWRVNKVGRDLYDYLLCVRLERKKHN